MTVVQVLLALVVLMTAFCHLVPMNSGTPITERWMVAALATAAAGMAVSPWAWGIAPNFLTVLFLSGTLLVLEQYQPYQMRHKRRLEMDLHDLDLSQSEFARMTGRSRVQVNRWVRNRPDSTDVPYYARIIIRLLKALPADVRQKILSEESNSTNT